jgi:hypothetical protein
MIKRGNKKAQELSIGTLVLIVLGVIVLVLVVLGFTMGWNNLLEKINIFSPSSNLDSIITTCGTASIATQEDAYCNTFRKVKIDDQNQFINCQYSRVQERLERKMDCSKTQDVLVAEKCRSLILKGQADAKTIVNDKKCIDTDFINNNMRCKEDLKGVLVTEAGKKKSDITCLNANNQYPNNDAGIEVKTKLTTGYAGEAADNICCIP